MAQTFYGEWFVQVVSRDAAFGQRFVVSGSDATDGAYDGVIGVSTPVSGDTWTLELEWNDNALALGGSPAVSGRARSTRFRAVWS